MARPSRNGSVIALAAAGKFSWSLVPSYILAQFIGAMLGAFFILTDASDVFGRGFGDIRDDA